MQFLTFLSPAAWPSGKTSGGSLSTEMSPFLCRFPVSPKKHERMHPLRPGRRSFCVVAGRNGCILLSRGRLWPGLDLGPSLWQPCPLFATVRMIKCGGRLTVIRSRIKQTPKKWKEWFIYQGILIFSFLEDFQLLEGGKTVGGGPIHTVPWPGCQD